MWLYTSHALCLCHLSPSLLATAPPASSLGCIMHLLLGLITANCGILDTPVLTWRVTLRQLDHALCKSFHFKKVKQVMPTEPWLSDAVHIAVLVRQLVAPSWPQAADQQQPLVKR